MFFPKKKKSKEHVYFYEKDINSNQTLQCVCAPVHTHARTHARACSVALLLSGALVFAAPWTVDCQAPQSMGLSRQHIGVGCHALLQVTIRFQGSNQCLLHPCVGRWFFTTSTIWEALTAFWQLQMTNEKHCYKQE